MKSEELSALIKSGETQEVEFKVVVPADINYHFKQLL